MLSIDERDQRSRFGRQRLPSSGEPPVTALGAFEAAGRFVDDLLETADSFKWKPIEGTPLFCMPNPNEDIDRLSRKYDRETMSGLMSVVELVESQNERPEHETLHRSLHVFLGWLDAALRTVLRCRWVTIGYIPQGGSHDPFSPMHDPFSPVLSPKDSTADIVRLRETYETEAAPAFQTAMKAIRDLSASEAKEEVRAVVQEAPAPGGTCVVCLEARPVMACVPCGHVCACVKCAGPIKKCPMCRTNCTMLRLFFP